MATLDEKKRKRANQTTASIARSLEDAKVERRLNLLNEMASAEKTPAQMKDLRAIFRQLKTYDPGSVVREPESRPTSYPPREPGSEQSFAFERVDPTTGERVVRFSNRDEMRKGERPKKFP